MEAEQLASVTPCLGASIRQGQAALRFDPSGSRTTSRSRIGPSFVNSVLIRSCCRKGATMESRIGGHWRADLGVENFASSASASSAHTQG
jgi:hypothetical protein